MGVVAGDGLIQGTFWGLWSQAAQVPIPIPSLPSWTTLGKWLNGPEPQWLQVRKEAVKTNPQVVVKIDSEDACKRLQVCGERLAVSLWERQVGGPGLALEALGSGRPCRAPSSRASLP